MSGEEHNDFMKQVKNGFAWAVGAQLVVLIVGAFFLLLSIETIKSNVSDVSKDSAAIRDDVKEMKVELSDVKGKAERLWWEREQRISPTR